MTEPRRYPPGALAVAAGFLIAALAWAYYPTFANLVRRWGEDPQASHGFLVLPLALLILWSRWESHPPLVALPSWHGVGLLALAAGLRFFAAYINFDWLDEFSFLIALTGVVLVVAGTRWVVWAGWSIAFLIFMIPVPFAVGQNVGLPLQRGATVASTYLLQTFGYPAVSQGNTIVVNQTAFGVQEACNGLGMLQSFVMLAAAMALLSRRSLAERLVLFASGLPIALVANLVRITATAMLMVHTTDPATHKTIHDVAGWLMIPLALLLLWLVLKFLDNLWLDPTGDSPSPTSPQPTPAPTLN